MRTIVQRVVSAYVEVDGRIAGAVGSGLLVLAGFEERDSDADLEWMAGKIIRLRIFSDPSGLMNRSVVDVNGRLLVVSQFTLFASTKRGNRPSWSRAARPDLARHLFERFVGHLDRLLGGPIETGVFGADMRVHLVNDGPVTIPLHIA